MCNQESRHTTRDTGLLAITGVLKRALCDVHQYGWAHQMRLSIYVKRDVCVEHINKCQWYALTFVSCYRRHAINI